MLHNKIPPMSRNMAPLKRQQGVVLVLALIVLVAMMLAGIGMMRSVDTANLIAGNMAFKQTTIHAGDRGISDGYNLLINTAANAKSDLSNSGDVWTTPNTWYLASTTTACEVLNNCPAGQSPWWQSDANWAGAPSVSVPGAGITVSYLVHRMCTTPGLGTSDPGNTCQTFEEAGTASGGSKVVGAVVFAHTSVFYRITSRSVGPRNTVSFSQALVLIPE